MTFILTINGHAAFNIRFIILFPTCRRPKIVTPKNTFEKGAKTFGPELF